MRTQYSPRRSSRWPVWIGIVALAAVGIIGTRFLLPGVFMGLAAPLSQSGTAISGSVGGVLSGFASNAQLAKENVQLAAEVKSLQNENAALTARTQDLTKLLGGIGQDGSGITAGVLARPPESPYDTLLVAAGSADGVAVGAEVFGQGGVPLGTVQSRTAHNTIVSLFSAPGRSVDGWVGANRTPLTLTGTGAGTYSAVISKSAAVATGDSVYVPGPGAIPVGTVVRIDSDPSSPSVTVRIQPAVNIFSITWVEISSNKMSS